MNKSKLTIISLVGIIVLLNAIYFPQIYKAGWGNNDLITLVYNEYGLQVECDYPLWQPPTDCRFTDEAQNTLSLLDGYGLVSEDAVLFATDPPPDEGTVPATTTATVYNPDITDWWADMIESLDGKSSTIWAKSGWIGTAWTEIKDIGNDTYRISIFGIAASGDPIVYTVIDTETAYRVHGPVAENGTMLSRIYPKITGEGYPPP